MADKPAGQVVEALEEVTVFPAVRCAHFQGREITDQNMCKGLAIDGDKNPLCISKGCLSIWKPCPACLEQGEIKRIGHRPEICCEPGKKLCEFHLTFGEKEKRKGMDVKAILAIKPVFQFPISVVKKITESKTKLLKDNKEVKVIGEVVVISRSRVLAFKDQPRKHFSKTKLQELADSIAEIGQRTPVEVKKISGNPDFDWELIDGERRYIALGMAGIDEMKAVVGEPKDSYEHFLFSVVANFCREGHNAMEIAYAVKEIKDKTGQSDEKIGKIFGKSGVWVNGYLHMVDLSPEIQAMMDPNLPKREQLQATIAMHVASGEKDHKKQLELVNQIRGGGMKTSHALSHIRATTVASGGTKTRERRPSDDYKILTDFLHRTKLSTTMLHNLGREKTQELFEKRPFDDRRGVMEDMNKIMAELKKMYDWINMLT